MVMFLEKKNKTLNSFSKKNIIRNNKMIINYVDEIKQKYQIILVSVISPLAETRKLAKKMVLVKQEMLMTNGILKMNLVFLSMYMDSIEIRYGKIFLVNL